MVVIKQFKPGKLLTVFFTLFFILFLYLGNWQLNRANEKTLLSEQVNSAATQFDDGQTVTPFSSLKVAGRFSEKPVFYMDNRTHNGQSGYEVWLFFETKQGVWLVSTGWLAGLSSRDMLPKVSLAAQNRAIEILVRPSSQNPLYGVETNKVVSTQAEQWLVQSLTTDWVSSLYPEKKILGLAQLKDSELFGVGPNVWQPSVMTVEKHLGYAMQWFGMSIALLGMFLYAGFSKKQK